MQYQLVITDEATPDFAKIRAEHPDCRLTVYTPAQAALLFLNPSLIYSLNKQYELKLPLDRANTLRQIETDVVSLGCTIEEAIHRNYLAEGTLGSKMRGLVRVTAMLERGGAIKTFGMGPTHVFNELGITVYENHDALPFCDDNDTPGKEVKYRDADGVAWSMNDYETRDIGHPYIHYIRTPPVIETWKTWRSWQRRKNKGEVNGHDLSIDRFLKEEGTRFNLIRSAFQTKGVLEDILAVIGKRAAYTNLTSELLNKWTYADVPSISKTMRSWFGDKSSILLYGSAAESIDTGGQFSDYDLAIVVPRILPSHYNALEKKALEYDGKRVGIVLVSQDVFPDFVIRNAYSVGLVQHGKILHDGLNIPHVSLPSIEHAVMRELTRSVTRMRILNSIALNDFEPAWKTPDLFRSCVKTPRFLLQSLLNYRRLGKYSFTNFRYCAKQEAEKMLADEGITTPAFSDDPLKNARALKQAVSNCARIADKHYPIPQHLKKPLDDLTLACGSAQKVLF